MLYYHGFTLGPSLTTLNITGIFCLIFRILFGRLRSKAGSKFQGKAFTNSRSSIILRFLAGCQAEELGIFINLLLEPVRRHSEGTRHHSKEMEDFLKT